MIILNDTILEALGAATPALLLYLRIARARAAHQRAMAGDFKLSPEYLEWLSYVYAAHNHGLVRPWLLPADHAKRYLEWLLASEDTCLAPWKTRIK